ncbi:ParA family protein [Thermosulfurimonas sp. F29]|uniref:ParA family protein n=1 Tax=Thermosulfurimonas sp. F29 TaxID=2867247 RepID=UPI001C830D3E|nr:ParA family protein [Thermosulfurimonas sp. F29]MBX6424215.1 ParA family protein [Thermosulfurimonas sp. F29]
MKSTPEISDTVILTFCNNKGGVGKTSLAILTVLYALKRNVRTLLIDLDPQGNATRALLPDAVSFEQEGFFGIPQLARLVLDRVPTEDLIRAFRENIVVADGIPFVPNDIRSAIMEKELNSLEAVLFLRKMRGALEDYRLVVVDTPPHLGGFLWSALCASTHVIIPVDLHFFSFWGLRNVLQTIEDARAVNPELKLAGILINRYRKRLRNAHEYLARYEETFGPKLLKNRMPDAAGVEVCIRRRDIRQSYLGKLYERTMRVLQEILERTGVL